MVLNGPHSAVFQSQMRANPMQLLKSYYVGFFQIPKLPEAVISAGREPGAYTTSMILVDQSALAVMCHLHPIKSPSSTLLLILSCSTWGGDEC